jgi:hypothetical protein
MTSRGRRLQERRQRWRVSIGGRGSGLLPQFYVDRIRALDVSIDDLAIGKATVQCARLGLGADRLDDELLQRHRGHACDATGVLVAALKDGMGDIVAISDAILVGVAGRHAIAAVVEEAAHQDRGRVFDAYRPRSHIFGEQGLDRFEGDAINDELVLAGMGLTAIDHLAEVEAVLEEMGQRADAVGATTFGTSVPPRRPRESGAASLWAGPWRLPGPTDRTGVRGNATGLWTLPRPNFGY